LKRRDSDKEIKGFSLISWRNLAGLGKIWDWFGQNQSGDTPRPTPPLFPTQRPRHGSRVFWDHAAVPDLTAACRRVAKSIMAHQYGCLPKRRLRQLNEAGRREEMD
jgi:hypothetical protein